MQRAVLINVGNTHAEFAAWADGRFGARERHPTAALLAPGWTSSLLAAHAGWPRVVASVVPAVRAPLDRAGGPLTWVTAATATMLDFSAVDPATLGADRIANAVAADARGALPAIVVDCGTALTLEVVDERHRFLGGAILPGRRLARQALARGTAQLPEAPLADSLPEPLGRHTLGAITAGVDLGLLGAIDRLLRDTSLALGGRGLPAIAVGGDRDFFVRHLDHLTPGPDDFTFSGLAALADRLP
jgi:type III pantothenate kinase